MSKTIEQGRYSITITSPNGAEKPSVLAAILSTINNVLVDQDIVQKYVSQEAEREMRLKNAQKGLWKFGVRAVDRRNQQYNELAVNANFFREFKEFSRNHPKLAFEDFYNAEVSKIASAGNVFVTACDNSLEKIAAEKEALASEQLLWELIETGTQHNADRKISVYADRNLKIIKTSPSFERVFGRMAYLSHLIAGDLWLDRMNSLLKKGIMQKAEDSFGIISWDMIPTVNFNERNFKIESCYKGTKEKGLDYALFTFRPRGKSYVMDSIEEMRAPVVDFAKEADYKPDIGTMETHMARRLGLGLWKRLAVPESGYESRLDLSGKGFSSKLGEEAVASMAQRIEYINEIHPGGITLKAPRKQFYGLLGVENTYIDDRVKAKEAKSPEFAPRPAAAYNR